MVEGRMPQNSTEVIYYQNELFDFDINDTIELAGEKDNDFASEQVFHIVGIIEDVETVFENESIKKVCQNGKYDIAVLRTFGIEVKGFYFDTMLASYVLDPDQKHGMDELSKQYLNYVPISISTLIDCLRISSIARVVYVEPPG